MKIPVDEAQWEDKYLHWATTANTSAKTKSSFYDSKRNLEPPKFKAYEDDSDLDGDDGDDISIMDDITDLPGILHLLGLFALAINYLNPGLGIIARSMHKRIPKYFCSGMVVSILNHAQDVGRFRWVLSKMGEYQTSPEHVM